MTYICMHTALSGIFSKWLARRHYDFNSVAYTRPAPPEASTRLGVGAKSDVYDCLDQSWSLFTSTAVDGTWADGGTAFVGGRTVDGNSERRRLQLRYHPTRDLLPRRTVSLCWIRWSHPGQEWVNVNNNENISASVIIVKRQADVSSTKCNTLQVAKWQVRQATLVRRTVDHHAAI